MVICSECRASNAEEVTECACGASLLPGPTFMSGRREKSGAPVALLSGERRVRKLPLLIRIVLFSWTVFGALYLGAGVLARVTTPMPDPLGELVSSLVVLQDRGTLDEETATRLTENARRASECGHVHIYAFPAPPPPPPSGGIGGGIQQPQDPLAQVRKNLALLRPDKVALELADEGRTVIAAMAWGC